MANDNDVRACLGEAAAAYAANKHSGGKGGNKGTRYEDYFLVHLVVGFAAKLIEDFTCADPNVVGQHYGFVDDARVELAGSTDYYQLKNKAAVSWTAEKHPLETDFYNQFRLSEYLGEKTPRTSLVLPTMELATSLRSSVPDAIKKHTSVLHFPWTETPTRLVLECDELRNHLAELANVDNPTDDVLVGVFAMLLIACLENPDGASVRTLLSRAASICPGQVRLLPVEADWDENLIQEFKIIIDGIPGLTYNTNRGFFCWKCLGTSGAFKTSVLSEEFTEFQNEVVRRNPSTFEEFEEVLP